MAIIGRDYEAVPCTIHVNVTSYRESPEAPWLCTNPFSFCGVWITKSASRFFLAASPAVLSVVSRRMEERCESSIVQRFCYVSHSSWTCNFLSIYVAYFIHRNSFSRWKGCSWSEHKPNHLFATEMSSWTYLQGVLLVKTREVQNVRLLSCMFSRRLHVPCSWHAWLRVLALFIGVRVARAAILQQTWRLWRSYNYHHDVRTLVCFVGLTSAKRNSTHSG